jgi:hypothetical protein
MPTIRSSIKRHIPLRSRPAKPRRGEPTPKEKAAIRQAVYERAGGLCELRIHDGCSKDRILPWAGDIFERAHLVHLHGKRRFGWREDPSTGQALLIGCYCCHIVAAHQQSVEIIVPERPPLNVRMP